MTTRDLHPKAGSSASGLLADVLGHLQCSREIMRDLPLPTYPKGGSVGIAAASEIMRCLRLATDELVGLMEQLDHHDQESPNDKLRHGGENQNV